MDIAAETRKPLSATPRLLPARMRRPLVYAMFAGAEAIAALSIGLCCAYGYLVGLQDMQAADFPWRLYLAHTALTAVIYGAFSIFTLDRWLGHALAAHTDVVHAFNAWTGANGLALLAAFLAGVSDDLSRVSLGTAYVLGVPVLLVQRRHMLTKLGARIAAGRLDVARMAVVGNRAEVVAFLMGSDLWRNGYRLAGALYLEDLAGDAETAAGKLDAFARACLEADTRLVVLAAPLDAFGAMERIGAPLRAYALDVAYAPIVPGHDFNVVDVLAVGPRKLLRIARRPLGDVAVVVKRGCDLALAALALLALAPLFAAVALAIRLDSPGPVFFRQRRRGFNGEAFFMWKFRSMRVTDSVRGAVQTAPGDPRITRVGRFLRRTSIDELPQLLNVLAGQMSLVGPRPHAIAHDDELARRIENYAHRRRMKPGITGWAQVNGWRGEMATFEAASQRTLHDLAYIDNWSLRQDLSILFLTVFSTRTHRNAR